MEGGIKVLSFKISHFEKQGIFKIGVFLQSAPFETRKLTSNCSGLRIFFNKHRCFKLGKLRKNSQILESRKLELFYLANIVEGTY